MSTTVATLGLWNIAAEQPDRVAVVDPAGREISYEELAAKANSYARGLQALLQFLSLLSHGPILPR